MAVISPLQNLIRYNTLKKIIIGLSISIMRLGNMSLGMLYYFASIRISSVYEFLILDEIV